MTDKFRVIGNWKMYGSNQQVEQYFSSLAETDKAKPAWFQKVDVAICPPFVYLPQASKIVGQGSKFKLGSQDVSCHASGPYTGQVSAKMLIEQGCQYAIVGHSERRIYCQESEEEIANKFFAAKAAGLIPILCVGETPEQRHLKLTESVVIGQLQPILMRSGVDSFQGAMIAYEPVWAIGTGLTATPEQAQEIHHLLRRTLAEYDATVAQKLPILYGGSVKANNATALFKMPDIDGALVGGASLEVSEFLAICEAAGNSTT